MNRKVRCGLVCCWLTAVVSLQAATGLTGSVFNFYGGVDAAVDVTDEANASEHFVGGVDSEGIFRFPDIPPGEYTIRITAIGFHDMTLHAVSVTAEF